MNAGMSGAGADEPLAKRIARAVLAVPGVVDLDGGVFGEVATYLPGERVSGIQLSDNEASLHIVVDLRHDLRDVAAQAAAVAADLADRPFSVIVEDVAVAEAGAATAEGGNDE